jgi:uncharacterized membrane protein
VPSFLGIAILAAIALLRSLQTAAFRSIQLASILEQVSQRGREVIEGVHPEILAASDRSGGLSNDRVYPVVETPSDGRDLLWPRRSSIVQTLDVPRLVRVAEHEGARIHLCVVPGETIFHLGVEVVDGADRTPRVVLKLPSWEDYVSVGLDEIIDSGLSSMQVRRRLGRLLDDLLAVAPPQHREPIERRLATMTGNL